MRRQLAASGLCLLLWIGFGAHARGDARQGGPGSPGIELVYPCCGMQPPAGLYLSWLHGAWRTAPLSLSVPVRQRQMAHLVVRVQRHAAARAVRDLGVELELRQGRDGRPPDVAVLTAGRAYAVWYGLAPGPAELRGRSGQTFLGPQPLDLLAGRIEYLEVELKPRPALEVELDLPAVLRQEELVLVVRRQASGEILAEETLKAAALSHRFEGLPPTALEIDLLTGFGTFTRSVDLSAGADGFVVLDPQLITLRGTVYHGDRSRPARLAFTTVTRTRQEMRTDENGAYEIVLVDPLLSVGVLLEEAGIEPYFEMFSPPIAESRELDIRLPDNDLRAHVLDAVTGAGIPAASVSVFHREMRLGYALDVATDETGTVQLPPLRRGALEIQALADGYLPMRQPARVQVDGRKDQVFEVRLEPVSDTVTLRLLLPDGAPAAGAEVLLEPSLSSNSNLFLASVRADAEGVVEIPRQAGFLLARHRATGFLVRPWRPREGEREVEWALPVAVQLTLRVRDASGNAVPQAGLELWVGGHRLSGFVLGWLTGTHYLTDANGSWAARNLPPGPIKALAWDAKDWEPARAGRLDAQAVRIPFPWPDPVEVRASE